jgi:hypothetical protein
VVPCGRERCLRPVRRVRGGVCGAKVKLVSFASGYRWEDVAKLERAIGRVSLVVDQEGDGRCGDDEWGNSCKGSERDHKPVHGADIELFVVNVRLGDATRGGRRTRSQSRVDSCCYHTMMD